MDISEVEEILGRTWLPKPRHVIMVTEPVTEPVDGVVFYRGVSQRFGDVVVLTPQAAFDTVYHEILHSLGLGSELVVRVISKVLALKAQILPALFAEKPRYQLCSGCEEFRVLHEKYAGRALHYRRV